MTASPTWLLVAIAGYLACLIAAWGLVWKFRATTAQWHGIADAWEAIADARETVIGRQQAIITALQMICRQAGMDVTITEQTDGVDLVVTPQQKAREIRH